MPRSKLLRTGVIGLFLSPSYKSSIHDWAFYVMSKKHKDHPLKKQQDRLFDEMHKLEDQQKVAPTPEIEQRLQEINEKIDKIRETVDLDNKAYWDSIKGYKTLYLHTIRCPIEVYEESKRLMESTYEDDPKKSFGFWGWGAQTFVEAKNLPKLEVVDVKEFNMTQLYNEYKQLSFNRHLQDPTQNIHRQIERERQEWQRKKDEETSKIPVDPNRYDHKKEMEKRRKEFDEAWARKKAKEALESQ